MAVALAAALELLCGREERQATTGTRGGAAGRCGRNRDHGRGGGGAGIAGRGRVLVVGGLRRACVGLVGPEGSIPPTLPAADSVRAQRAGEAVCAGAAARGGCKHDPAAKAEGMRRVSMMSSGLVTYPTKPHPSCAPGAHTAQEGSASWRAGQGKRGGGGAAAASSYWAVLPAPAPASRTPARRVMRRLGSRRDG